MSALADQFAAIFGAPMPAAVITAEVDAMHAVATSKPTGSDMVRRNDALVASVCADLLLRATEGARS